MVPNVVQERCRVLSCATRQPLVPPAQTRALQYRNAGRHPPPSHHRRAINAPPMLRLTLHLRPCHAAAPASWSRLALHRFPREARCTAAHAWRLQQRPPPIPCLHPPHLNHHRSCCNSTLNHAIVDAAGRRAGGVCPPQLAVAAAALACRGHQSGAYPSPTCLTALTCMGWCCPPPGGERGGHRGGEPDSAGVASRVRAGGCLRRHARRLRCRTLTAPTGGELRRLQSPAAGRMIGFPTTGAPAKVATIGSAHLGAYAQQCPLLLPSPAHTVSL